MIIEMSKGYQITIPAKIRNELGWKPGTKLEVHKEANEAVIRPLEAESFSALRSKVKTNRHYDVDEIKRLGRE